MTDNTEYKSFLADLAISIQQNQITNTQQPIHEIVGLLRFGEDNRSIRDLCVKLGITTKGDFNREMNKARQREVLGSAPANATELIRAYATKFNLRSRMDGLLVRDVAAEMPDYHTGKMMPISADDRLISEIDLYASFKSDAKGRMNRLDLERELRILCDQLKINITAQNISDAVEEWMKKAKRERLHDIFLAADCREPGYQADAVWTRLADSVFDCSETSADFVASVLRKFIWQVKRKIRGIEVTDHLMPVILGPQGIGKSTLVNRLLSPVEELKLNVDFKQVTDERNVAIWDSYVMFLDEMGYASKADIDAVKNIITATTLTRRPMRTNDMITISQNSTFIGCSNRELAQLVRDPTGNRRFVAIRMRTDADRTLINELDWAALWGSVSINDADPMSDHREMLAGQQEETRERSRVEQWMADFNGEGTAYHAGVNKAGNISAANLYDGFREYEERVYPGHFKTAKTDWDFEMARLRKNAPDKVVFDHKRGGSGIMYRWKLDRNQRCALRLID